MKTCTRWLLALLLVATPMLAAIPFASANTELAPASRLVAPLVTLETGRSTFLLITNVSTLELTGTLDATDNNPAGVVHIEFYSKACTPSSDNITLSARDIDQLNVTSTNASSVFADSSKLGFADIDVREAALISSTSRQANALLGEVVITDTVADFALSYPMASSLGSAATGAATSASAGSIVARGGSGLAANWTGRYEPFPSRIFVPGFYAEGGTGQGAVSTASTAPLGTILAVVSPADGNWYGGSADLGEAPGQSLTALPSGAVLISAGINVWDGCEQVQNFPKTGHTIMDTLGNLFGTYANRDTAPWTACPGVKPSKDELSGNPVGWIDVPNVSCSRNDNENVAAGIGTGACTTAAPTASLGKARGLVGVLFETTTVKSGTTLQGGDVARLWGDFSSISQTQTGCATSDGGTSAGTWCPYSFATGSSPNNVTMP